jgi:hypothetical protein
MTAVDKTRTVLKFMENLRCYDNSYVEERTNLEKMIRIRLGDLRRLIRESIEEKKNYHFGGSAPEEDYTMELLDDPDFEAKSVYVPDDIKEKIRKWSRDMKLSNGAD